VLDEDGVPVLHLDMKDEIRYAALVVRIVLDQLAGAGVDGRLAPRRPPEAAFPYDSNADLYTGMQPLTELDGRGLPPGFPDGFPIPEQATLVLAQRCQDGSSEHAAWRRTTGPFTGVLALVPRSGGATCSLTCSADPDDNHSQDAAGHGTTNRHPSSSSVSAPSPTVRSADVREDRHCSSTTVRRGPPSQPTHRHSA